MRAKLSLFLISMAGCSHASDKPSSADDIYQLTLEELMSVKVVSLATGREKSLVKAPSIASVVTAEEIKQMGARTLGEVLSTVPGLHVSNSSQIMGPKYVIRGINTRFNAQVLMMVDGVPITSAVRGDRHVIWGYFPVNAISRVEVIRGPGSALYGADAFSGVIHVITKDYDQAGDGDLGGRYGSFSTNEMWAAKRWQIDDLKLYASAEYGDTDGHKQIVDFDAQSAIDSQNLAPAVSNAPGPVEQSYRGLDFRFAAQYRGLKLNLGFQNRDNVGLGTGGSNALDPDGRSGSEKFLANVVYQHRLSDTTTGQIQLSHYRSTQNIEENVLLFPKGAFFGSFPDGVIGNPGWREKSETAQMRLNYAPSQNLQSTIGVGWRNEDLYQVTETRNFSTELTPLDTLIDVSDTELVFIPEQQRVSRFGFYQGEYQFANHWELTFGIRHDDYQDFGTTTNPRIALVWGNGNDISSKLLFGRAFRSPNFLELKEAFDPVNIGNQSLKPETINTTEWSLSYQQSQDLFWDISIYRFDAKNLIDYVPIEHSTLTVPQNFTSLKGYGSEVELTYNINNTLSLNANYAWQNVSNERDNSDYGNAPNNQAYARLQWQFSNTVSVIGQIHYIGTSKRNPHDNRAPLNAYKDISLMLKFDEIFDHFQLQLKVTNLLDDDIREPSLPPSSVRPQVEIPGDIPQAGRAFYLSLNRTW